MPTPGPGPPLSPARTAWRSPWSPAGVRPTSWLWWITCRGTRPRLLPGDADQDPPAEGRSVLSKPSPTGRPAAGGFWGTFGGALPPRSLASTTRAAAAVPGDLGDPARVSRSGVGARALGMRAAAQPPAQPGVRLLNLLAVPHHVPARRETCNLPLTALPLANDTSFKRRDCLVGSGSDAADPGKSLCANIPTPAPVLSHRSGGSWPGLQRRGTLTRDSCFITLSSKQRCLSRLARWLPVEGAVLHGATLLSPIWLGSFLRAAQRLQVAWALSTDERVYARVWNVLNAVKGLGKKHGG